MKEWDMIKTKIKFEDIAAGDLLEVVVKEFGVKSVMTGIAFKLERMDSGKSRESVWWETSEGGMIVNTDEDSGIYRIDVREAGFGDIEEGDLIEVSAVRGEMERVVRGRAVKFVRSDASWYDGWATADGSVMVRRRSTDKIVVLEREA